MTRAGRVVATALLASLVVGCALFREDPGAALRGRVLMVPVAGVDPEDVPDTFEHSREGGRRRHEALDIPAPRGTPVVSAEDGVVLAVRENRRGGRTMWVGDAHGRVVYYYAHLERYRAGLRAGTKVARGDVLAYVGTSGNADRAMPHLHFQVLVVDDGGDWRHGRPVDPRPYLRDTGAPR